MKEEEHGIEPESEPIVLLDFQNKISPIPPTNSNFCYIITS